MRRVHSPAAKCARHSFHPGHSQGLPDDNYGLYTRLHRSVHMGVFTRVLLQGGQMIIMACTLSTRPDTAKCARHSYHSGSCHGRPGNNYGLYTRPTQGALGSTARVARSKGDSVESRDAGVTAFRHLRVLTKRGLVCLPSVLSPVRQSGRPGHPYSTAGDTRGPKTTPGDSKKPGSTPGDTWGPSRAPSCRRNVSLARALSPARQSGPHPVADRRVCSARPPILDRWRHGEAKIYSRRQRETRLDRRRYVGPVLASFLSPRRQSGPCVVAGASVWPARPPTLDCQRQA